MVRLGRFNGEDWLGQALSCRGQVRSFSQGGFVSLGLFHGEVRLGHFNDDVSLPSMQLTHCLNFRRSSSWGCQVRSRQGEIRFGNFNGEVMIGLYHGEDWLGQPLGHFSDEVKLGHFHGKNWLGQVFFMLRIGKYGEVKIDHFHGKIQEYFSSWSKGFIHFYVELIFGYFCGQARQGFVIALQLLSKVWSFLFQDTIKM